MKKYMRIAIPFTIAGLMVGLLYYLPLPDRVTASARSPNPEAAIIVTTLEDELNSDGDCSLREAVIAANENSAVDACTAGGSAYTDAITFDVVGNITVTSQLSVTAGGPLVIDGGDVITTSGGGTNRVWWVDSGSELTLSHLVMVNGQSGEGGSLYNNMGTVTLLSSTFSSNQGAEGGAIYNFGTMHIRDSQFTQNDAPAVGGSILNDGIMTILNSNFNGNTSNFSCGAIDSWGPLTITDSVFINNSTSGGCGAIGGGKLSITHSKFSGNTANMGGGGVCMFEGSIVDSTFTGNIASSGGGIAGGHEGEGDIDIINSTISGNTASSSGGGFYDEGKATIINSTISGNNAGIHGGGITISAAGYTPSTLMVEYSTISDNIAPVGGGIHNYGNTTLLATIVANSQSANDCQVDNGSLTDAGHNLDSDGSCSLDSAKGSLPNTDPLLGPIQDNGGHTFTQALLPGSPAIDAGDNNVCPEFDQRGMYRPIDGDGNGLAVCDMGAFEAGGSLLTVTTLEDEVITDGDCSLREAIEAANTNSAIDLCGPGNPNFDMVNFDVAGAIGLTDPLTVTNSGKVVIYGGDAVSMDGAGTTRVMWVDPGVILKLLNLTIKNGFSSGNGGGLYNNGTLTIANSTISGNTGGFGGGIYSSGSLTIYQSTLFENSALNGGGISNWGTLVITNSTISANNADNAAGGIDNWGDMELFNCSVSQNSGEGTGGIYASQLGDTTFINSIVANNQGGDCYGPTIDGGHDLDSDGTCNLNPTYGSLPNIDPLLGPLQDNGGPTFTQALLSGSPAIDAGDDAKCPATDQRAYPRPIDGNGDGIAICDIGAYEDNNGYLLVNTLEDTLDEDGYCSLREALEAANTNNLVDDCGHGSVLTDTISFSVEGTITVTSQLTVLPGGPLSIDGGDVIRVSAGGIGRVWWVEADSSLSMRGLSVTDALLGDQYGGGLYNNSGSVDISDCKFLGNTAEWGGGAIYNLGTLNIANSSFEESIASGSLGGAIWNLNIITVTNSTFVNNLSYLCGGINNDGMAVVNGSTFSGNTAFWGGAGLCNYGALTLINSTVSGNTISQGYGGGIYNTGTMTMTDDTITDNSATSGGGIDGGLGVIMVNTIIANNPGGDCKAPITDAGHNLDSDGSCGLNPASGSLLNTDPLLGPLQRNGGPTLTHALLEGSPAIDAGDNAQCPNTDQRGVHRPLDGNDDGTAVCDIGSYEFIFVAQRVYFPIVFRSP